MTVSAGDKLGPYQILAPIGAGGMGEVWKALDTRLDRIVAIKFAQDNFSDRFEREARAVAALNHPNICQLYDVGPNYLVMEFIEGVPLSPVDSTRKFLDLAAQIADGLSEAHAASVIHRDLKPPNILVTRAGRVKILDFGLAKQQTSRADPGTTLTMAITNAGTVVGTVNYMSPEQARGEQNLGAQSDQFSFGLVLYELASGKRAFQRASAAETMTAIIREDAEPLPGSVPAPVRWVIERLLAKEPSERYESTRDLYREIKQLRDRLSVPDSAVAAPVPRTVPKRRRFLATLVTGGVCLVAGVVASSWLVPPVASGPDLANYKFTPLAIEDAEKRSPVWSPDGKSIAYTARIRGVMQVFTGEAGTREATQLTKASQDCASPFWSLDGATVYWVSGHKLWSTPAAGGAVKMAFENLDSAALHPDGRTLAFERGRKVWIGSLEGGETKQFWPGPSNGALRFSPDGSKLAATAIGGFWVLPYPSGTPRKLTSARVLTAPGWFPDSRRLAVSVRSGSDQRTILAIFDSVEATSRTIGSGPSGFTYPSVSPDGKRIAYATGQAEWDVLEISIPEGHVRTLISKQFSLTPDWAPSGTHFIFSTPVGEGRGIEDRQAGGEGFSRRLSDANLHEPRWSPDGARFAVYEEVNGTSTLKIANASGNGMVSLDSTKAGTLRGISWSPDGQWISYIRSVAEKQELAKVRATPGVAPEIVPNARPQPWLDAETCWSPSGEWIAYPSADGIDLISPDGKSPHNLTPRKLGAYGFSKDGSQLYGVSRDTTGTGAQWKLFSVNVRTGAEKFLAPIDLQPSVDRIAGFSIHPDGKSFLTSVAKFPFDIWMLQGFEQPRSANWFARLLRRD